jgi:hypothetical protein
MTRIRIAALAISAAMALAGIAGTLATPASHATAGASTSQPDMFFHD